MFWPKSKPPKPRVFCDRLPTYGVAEVGRMSEAMRTDGFVLIPGVLTMAEVQAARDKIDELEPRLWDFTGLTDHYKNVFNRDPFWLSFIDRPGVIDVAEATLGG